MKTVTDLFNEYYDKPCNERINSTVQNYVFDHQQAKIDELQARIDATEKWIELNRKTIALEYSGYTTEEYVDADEVTGILKGGSSE